MRPRDNHIQLSQISHGTNGRVGTEKGQEHLTALKRVSFQFMERQIFKSLNYKMIVGVVNFVIHMCIVVHSLYKSNSSDASTVLSLGLSPHTFATLPMTLHILVS